jgi:hypothetical protein
MPLPINQDLADFLHNNWKALKAVAVNAPPDHVLVTWMGQRHLIVQAKLREDLIAEDPDAAPDSVKEGPRPLAPGAVASVWIAICRRVDDTDDFTISWCTADFMRETETVN